MNLSCVWRSWAILPTVLKCHVNLWHWNTAPPLSLSCSSLTKGKWRHLAANRRGKGPTRIYAPLSLMSLLPLKETKEWKRQSLSFLGVSTQFPWINLFILYTDHMVMHKDKRSHSICTRICHKSITHFHAGDRGCPNFDIWLRLLKEWVFEPNCLNWFLKSLSVWVEYHSEFPTTSISRVEFLHYCD